jgi:hypothetical protein
VTPPIFQAMNKTWSRRRVFVYEIVVLCALWTFAGLHLTGVLVVPDQFGTIPVGVPFFGAVGAVLVSLSAVFDFRGEGWDPRWEAWHYTRWLIGGSVGIISVLIFQAGIISTGITVKDIKATNVNLTYYLIAFAVGYRESTFRELIKRLVEVILTPGSGDPPPSVTKINPDHGTVHGGDPVAIVGANLAKVNSVLFGDQEAKIVGQGSESAVTIISPKGEKTGDVPVTVQTTAGADATLTFKYV